MISYQNDLIGSEFPHSIMLIVFPVFILYICESALSLDIGIKFLKEPLPQIKEEVERTELPSIVILFLKLTRYIYNYIHILLNEER